MPPKNPMIRFSSINNDREFCLAYNNVKRFPNQIHKIAYLKLLIIDGAEQLEDLRVPTGNSLEKLSDNLSGKYSIRINNQWRIIFSWKENNAYEVVIIDYHKG